MSGGNYENVVLDISCTWDQFNIRPFKVTQKGITGIFRGHVESSSEMLCRAWVVLSLECA